MDSVRAEDVTKYYGKRVAALRDLNLSLSTQTFTALVGPNGAGKSTLLKLLVGLERPTRGTLSVFGINPTNQREKALAMIGYVPQSPVLYRDLTVADHLDLAEHLRPSFDKRLAALRLEELGFRGHELVRELSGGAQSQVMLSLALGTRAPLLLLDEPLASLDPLARREFLRTVSGHVNETGATCLLASHITTDLETACDQIVILGSAQLLYQGTIADAIATHSVVRGVVAEQAIGVFDGMDGERRSLIQHSGRLDPKDIQPTLDDLVIGYLASSTRGRQADGLAS